MSNVGDATADGLSGQTPVGELTCADPSLEAGASTECWAAVTAPSETGGYVFAVTVQAVDSASGEDIAADREAFFVSAQPQGQGGTGQGTGDAGNRQNTQSGGDYGNSSHGDTNGGSGSQVTEYPDGGVAAGSGSTAVDRDWMLMAGGLLLLAALALSIARRARVQGVAGDRS
ncbi:MAG: hypothetical protein ACTH2Q_19840 [Propionibacteriaceae bacterium]